MKLAAAEDVIEWIHMNEHMNGHERHKEKY